MSMTLTSADSDTQIVSETFLDVELQPDHIVLVKTLLIPHKI